MASALHFVLGWKAANLTQHKSLSLASWDKVAKRAWEGSEEALFPGQRMSEPVTFQKIFFPLQRSRPNKSPLVLRRRVLI